MDFRESAVHVTVALGSDKHPYKDIRNAQDKN